MDFHFITLVHVLTNISLKFIDEIRAQVFFFFFWGGGVVGGLGREDQKTWQDKQRKIAKKLNRLTEK